MEAQPSYRSLLRLFYQYQVELILLFTDNRVSGFIEKKKIEELMSDLTHAQNIHEIPHEQIANIEDALMILLKSNLMKDGQKALPVVDRNGKFLGLWTNSEILGSGLNRMENPSPVFHTPPEAHPGIEASLVSPDVENTISEPKVKPAVKIHVSSETPKSDTGNIQPETNPSKSPDKTNLPDQTGILDHDYISIKTLEALPIPMLALDTKGGVLFYNQDWVELQKKNKDALGVKNLMNMARDLMAKMAFDGELEIHSVLNLPVSAENYIFKMRSILNDGNQIAKVLGYIFWAEPGVSKNSETPKKDNKKKKIQSQPETSEDHGQKYLGKTLVELLREEEKKIMLWAMDEANQNQSNAAMLLGIPRQTFSYRYHKLFDDSMGNKLK